MKVYLACSDPRLAERVGATIRVYWRDADMRIVPGSTFIVPDIFQGKYTLVILTADLAFSDNIDRIANIRSVSDVPVIGLVFAEDELLEARMLDSGADKVLPASIPPLLLISHIRAVLRRVDDPDEADISEEFACGDLVINYGRRRVMVKGQQVMLTPTEYRLLFLLAKNAGRVMSHRTLIDRTWGVDTLATADHLKVNISRIRSKLREADGQCPIESLRGVGYRLQVPDPGVPSRLNRG